MYGQFIRSVRTRRGLTQQALAEIAGLPQSNLSAYETGRRNPSVDVLNRLVVAAGLQLAATDGRGTTVWCDLPRAGWFPDEFDPGGLPGDPADLAPVLPAYASPQERAEAIAAVLDLAEASTAKDLD